jgi:acyl-CoA thioester hydrolase
MKKFSQKLLNPQNIPPLTIDIQRTVRFEELDPMGIMWHGRYLSWFEDGREALGHKYGISYLDFYHNQVAAPVKHFSIDYRSPLLHDHVYTIRTDLLWSDATRMDFCYQILDASCHVMTRAESVQLFTDAQGELLLEYPEFYKHMRQRWKQGVYACPSVR